MSWIWGNDVTAEQANMVVMSLQGELDERQATIEALVKALQKEKQDYKLALMEEVEDLQERKNVLLKELSQIDALIDTKTQQITSGEMKKSRKKTTVGTKSATASKVDVQSSSNESKSLSSTSKDGDTGTTSNPPVPHPAAGEPEPERTIVPCNVELAKVREVDSNTAFIIQRSNNANTVIYKGNLKSNMELDAKSPLHIYWIMYALPGPPFPTEELNVIERNTAYGATATQSEANPKEFIVALASLKDRSIVLIVDENNCVRARTTINNRKNVYLERVFVQSTTSWGLPKVEFVEIFGVDPITHEAVYEKKLP